MAAKNIGDMVHHLHCAQMFATQYSGAALAECNLAEAVVAAQRVVAVCERLATEHLAWDSVAIPIGNVMLRYSHTSEVAERQ
ncbi:hypothetical protein D8I24_0513 (plasmid) [Cupriavidus necator H850]|uniref:hypothetical protein n=1 Tax=Cupriavidus necator TaxID=106590 RepID=UPI00129D90CC|nr:hypothetical protein [Cupriavidus necator]KAI3610251.1 hypothetical protein D8I24_0513 [Cupriavidus necator H850]